MFYKPHSKDTHFFCFNQKVLSSEGRLCWSFSFCSLGVGAIIMNDVCTAHLSYFQSLVVLKCLLLF